MAKTGKKKTASATKAKATKAAPVAAKKRGRKSTRPAAGSGGILDLRRPPTVQATLAIARALDNGDAIKLGVLQSAIMPRADYKALILARNAAADAGKDLPSLPLAYQAPIIEAALANGVDVIYMGQESKGAKQPKNWPGNAGKWEAGMRIGAPRLCHVADLRQTVNDPANLVDFNGTPLIIGDKDSAAVHNFNPHANRDGTVKSNYGMIAQVDKALSLDGVKGIAAVVFSLNTSAVAVTLDDGTKPGAQMVWRAFQVATAATVVKGGKNLTHAQIRALVKSGDFKGATITPLSEEIVGQPLSESEIWQGVKSATGKDAMAAFEGRSTRSGETTAARDKVLLNQGTICRASSRTGMAIYLFGVKHGPQTNVALVRHFDEETGKARQVTVIVGVRLGNGYGENQWDARARTTEEDEQPEVEAAPVKAVEAEVEAEAPATADATAEPATATAE